MKLTNYLASYCVTSSRQAPILCWRTSEQAMQGSHYSEALARRARTGLVQIFADEGKAPSGCPIVR